MSAPARDALERVRAVADRRLSASEVETYLATPISAAEREDVRALVAWFRRRYPTGADRLAYVRRAYRRWQPKTGP